MYNLDVDKYPEWVKTTFSGEYPKQVTFETIRDAESARNLMYAYLKATERSGKFTIRSAGGRLWVVEKTKRIPKVEVVVQSQPQEVHNQPQEEPQTQEAQLITKLGLKVKTLVIGKKTYWSIINDRPLGDFEYATTLQNAIKAYLERGNKEGENKKELTAGN